MFQFLRSIHGLFQRPALSIPAIIITLFLYSCEKEEDLPAFIEFIRPDPHTLVKAGDSIWIEALVSDDNDLNFISIQLLDGNGYPASTPLVYYPGNKDFHINTLYHINKSNLESGNYLLTIHANDGKNSTKLAREIEIQGLPLQRQKIISLCLNGSSLQVIETDSASGFSVLNTFGFGYLSSSVSSGSHSISMITPSNPGFVIIETNDGSIRHQMPPPCPISQPCYTYLHFQNELNFISHTDGKVIGYDDFGNQKFSIQEQGFFRSGASILNGNYFYSEIYYPGASLNKIGTFFYPGGAQRQEAVIDLDVLCFFNKAADELYVFGTRNGHFVLSSFNRQTNRMTQIRDFGNIHVYAVHEEENGSFFILTAQGILNYRVDQNQLTSVSNWVSTQLSYDPLNNEYFIADRNLLRVLDAGNFMEKKHYVLPDSIVNIHIVYNR